MPFATWLVEARHIDRNEPVLSAMSPELLRDPPAFLRLREEGHEEVVDYAVQRIQQFQNEGDFAMRHSKTRELDEVYKSLAKSFLPVCTPEERVEGLSPDDRLRGLTSDDRLRGLTSDDRLRGLTLQERLKDFALDEISAFVEEQRRGKSMELPTKSSPTERNR